MIDVFGNNVKMFATFGVAKCWTASIPVCANESPVWRSNKFSTSVWVGVDSQPGPLPQPAVELHPAVCISNAPSSLAYD